MEPKANEAIDSLIKQAESPSIAEFLFKHMDIPGMYERTNVPGESELYARVLGIENIVNPYTYLNTQSVTPAIPFLDDDLYRINTQELEEEASYFPEQSPLLETETNMFNVNPDTEFGKNLQDRIDMSYSQAVLGNTYGINPDTGERMLKGTEPLLGDIYFDEDGNFEDVWDIGIGKYEESGSHVLSQLLDYFRKSQQDKYQMNIPTVKGKARNLKSIDSLQNQYNPEYQGGLDLPLFIEGIN